MAGTIGCEAYRVFLQRRGGAKLTELPWSQLSFNRKVDDITRSAVLVPVGDSSVADPRCYAYLSDVVAYEHEIAIWADDHEAWVGPVQEVEYTEDAVSIQSRDLFRWFEVRTLPNNRTWTNEDVSRIFRAVAIDALSNDTSPNISISPRPTGVLATRVITAASRTIAATLMRELARTGIDFTMLARTMHVGGAELPLAALGTLTTDMIINPSIRPDGISAASLVHVIGATTGDGQTLVESRGAISPQMGLVERVYSETTIRDVHSAKAAAQGRYAMLKTPPPYISGRLMTEAPFALADLIPGRQWPVAVEAGIKSVVGPYRLREVTASVSASGDAGISQSITPTLVPVGSSDTAEGTV